MKLPKLYWLILIMVFCGCRSQVNELIEIRKLQKEDRVFLSRGKMSQTDGIDNASQIRIEELVNDIKSWKCEGQFFPWEDVALSLLKHPEDINFNSGLCERCNDTIIALKFVSPRWTWTKLCGRAGDMRICPGCRTQLTFDLKVSN